MIDGISVCLKRKINVLDVGGRPEYWKNVNIDAVSGIEILNLEEGELQFPAELDLPRDVFTRKVGDARDLSAYADGSVDLVHSNSVIEHVGGWADMTRMANELMRVGRAGWVQTPAWEFPIEPHFRAPFLHWFGRPMQARMLSLSAMGSKRLLDVATRRRQIEQINLLSRRELQVLFPNRSIYVERVILPKSYSVYWDPFETSVI